MRNPCTDCELSKISLRPKTVVCYPGDPFCANCKEHEKYENFRESKRKYIKGETIRSIADFEKHIEEDGFVYFNNKIKHEGWILSMQYRIVRNAINRGLISVAIRKDKTDS